MRAPLWLIALLLLFIVGVGVYAYFTTPLPFGLSQVIQTPGGARAIATPTTGAAPGSVPSARSGAGQPLTLGAVVATVQGVQRNVDFTAGTGRGPVGSFTVVQLSLQNGGSRALTPRPEDFQLTDDRGRVYAVDVEATRAAAEAARRRLPFEATVPPGGRLETVLAFEPAPDAATLALRVTLGYGEVELPRP